MSKLLTEEEYANIKEKKSYVLNVLIPDLISSLLYYDRKEDDELSVKEIEELLKDEYFRDKINKKFKTELNSLFLNKTP